MIQTDTAELVSQTATLRRPRALLPAIIAVNRLHGIFGRRARARRRTRACTPCAAARAQLPACRTPLLRHPLLRAAALKQNFGGSPLRTIPARGVELSAKKHESSLRCSGINSRGRPGGCCVVVTTRCEARTPKNKNSRLVPGDHPAGVLSFLRNARSVTAVQ